MAFRAPFLSTNGTFKYLNMAETIDIKSLMRVSKFARIMNKSAAWVHGLAREDLIDLVIIDGYHFVRINEKSRKYFSN